MANHPQSKIAYAEYTRGYRHLFQRLQDLGINSPDDWDRERDLIVNTAYEVNRTIEFIFFGTEWPDSKVLDKEDSVADRAARVAVVRLDYLLDLTDEELRAEWAMFEISGK